MNYTAGCHGEWRSLVARSVRDAEVAGSNPVSPTSSPAGRRPRPAWFPPAGPTGGRQPRSAQSAMVVGVCRVVLHLPENQSLKTKRQIVKSVLGRVRHRFEVSAAEIEDQDVWQVATLGLGCVGNDARTVNAVLSRAVDFIERDRPEIPLLDYEIEILHAL
jgi:uncharacterized protein YlxP (DUF503 family)